MCIPLPGTARSRCGSLAARVASWHRTTVLRLQIGQPRSVFLTIFIRSTTTGVSGFWPATTPQATVRFILGMAPPSAINPPI